MTVEQLKKKQRDLWGFNSGKPEFLIADAIYDLTISLMERLDKLSDGLSIKNLLGFKK